LGTRGNDARIGAHVILKKQNILVKPPVDFFGRAEAAVETKLARIALSRMTVRAVCLLPIAVGAVLGESVQFVLRLPLLPASSVLAEDEIVRRMPDNLTLAACVVVIQRNCLGLIVKLQCLRSCSISKVAANSTR
jgi:hypothetical protein